MVKTIYLVSVHDGEGNMIPDRAFSNKKKANSHARKCFDEYKKYEREADFRDDIEVNEVEFEE
jgi:hypothetical protein